VSRPVIGIYTSIEPASWGPWRDRPSEVAPAAVGDAVQRAGAMAVLLAPDPDLEHRELLTLLDGLVVFDDAGELDALLGAARELDLAVVVLAAARVTAASAAEDFELEIGRLLALRS
jgi:hypothetical protein